MKQPEHSVFTQLIRASRYACQGLVDAWRSEPAFRYVSFLSAIALIVILLLPLPLWACLLLTLAHGLSLIVELLNSAIESAVDHTSLKQHPLAKRAKDFGAAAQLVTLLFLALLWLLLLINYT